MTDPLTGLPNARYLEITARDLAPAAGGRGPGYHLLAYRVPSQERVCARWGGAAAERLLAVLARRLASQCDHGEVPIRYGHDLFLVLRPAADPRLLAERWNELLRALEREAVELPHGPPHTPRVVTARASCPEDGRVLDELLAALDRRLAPDADPRHRVVPFRLS